MTALYQIRVLSVNGDQLACEVTAVYHGVPLSPSPTLATQLLWDVWHRLAEGWVNDDLYFGVMGPITVDEAERLAGESAISQLGEPEHWEEWVRRNTHSIVRAVTVTEAAPRSAIDLGYPPDEENDGGNEEFASAIFCIALTDPKWSSHLRPGMEWQTCAYVMEGER